MDAMDPIFRALADSKRRRMLDLVKASPGCNVNAVCAHFPLSRIAVMKHLRLLEDAGLLLSRKQGRERLLFINAVPLQLIHERWLSQYSALWGKRLTRLKFHVDQPEGRRDDDAEE